MAIIPIVTTALNIVSKAIPFFGVGGGGIPESEKQKWLDNWVSQTTILHYFPEPELDYIYQRHRETGLPGATLIQELFERITGISGAPSDQRHQQYIEILKQNYGIDIPNSKRGEVIFDARDKLQAMFDALDSGQPIGATPVVQPPTNRPGTTPVVTTSMAGDGNWIWILMMFVLGLILFFTKGR